MAWIEANPEIHENLEKIKAAVENGQDFDEMEEQLLEMTRKLGAASAGQWIARRERESFKEAKEREIETLKETDRIHRQTNQAWSDRVQANEKLIAVLNKRIASLGGSSKK